MNCSPVKWNELPVLALGKIYEYIEPQDRLNASITCKHWRSVLFQKRFFTNFTMKLEIDNDKKYKFFRHTLYNLTSEVIIIFDFLNVFHIEKIRRILYKLGRSDSLNSIRFQTNSVGFEAPNEMDQETLVDIETFFIAPLKRIVHRKSTPLKTLDLGAIEALTYYGLDILKELNQPNKMQELTLACIKYDPSHYPLLTLETSLIQQFTSLQVLSLDYDTISEELLHAIQILPLKKFLICVHGLDPRHHGISEESWAEFSANFNNIDLIVSLIYALEAVDVLQVRVLRRNMPITHLRVLFCNYLNIEALEWISINNSSTLRSIQWIDSAYKHFEKNILSRYVRSGQDPFVMLSWRCRHLEELVVHGYVMDPHNIVGISRLRGHCLKRLEVSMLDKLPPESTMDSFVEEINSLLCCQKWRPLNVNELHSALGISPVSEDVRDSFVFDLIRRDISN